VNSINVSTWAGGQSPFATGAKKLGMWLFVISDSLTFASLLVGYTYLRMAAPAWPTPFPFFPSIVLASVMTVVLLSSSLTMVRAVEAMRAADSRAAVRWLLVTLAAGLLFVGLHLGEWNSLFRAGVTPFRNPWDEPLFGATFFTLTGLHMLHVLAGVVYLAVMAAGVARGRYTLVEVEVSGLYWHFVDLVWMFIFPLVYLMSARL
jgi:cytochrome c oxidase subunit 3